MEVVILRIKLDETAKHYALNFCSMQANLLANVVVVQDDIIYHHPLTLKFDFDVKYVVQVVSLFLRSKLKDSINIISKEGTCALLLLTLGTKDTF